MFEIYASIGNLETHPKTLTPLTKLAFTNRALHELHKVQGTQCQQLLRYNDAQKGFHFPPSSCRCSRRIRHRKANRKNLTRGSQKFHVVNRFAPSRMQKKERK